MHIPLTPRYLLCFFALLLSACSSVRFEEKLEIFLIPVHKAPEKPEKATGHEVLQFVDDDRNAYVTYWVPRAGGARNSEVEGNRPQNTALGESDANEAEEVAVDEITGNGTVRPFAEVRKTCLEAQQESLEALRNLPVSQLDVERFAPENYKAVVQCIFDAGFNLIKRDSFYPDMYSLVFARKVQSEEAWQPLPWRYYVIRAATGYAQVVEDARACAAQADTESGPTPVNEAEWQDAVAVPYKERFINCLVSLQYRVAQN